LGISKEEFRAIDMACSVFVGFRTAQKETARGLKSGAQRRTNVSGEPKETAISGEIMPADGRNPARHGEFGTSPPTTVGSLSLTNGRGK
jgi:hypothetical protein